MSRFKVFKASAGRFARPNALAVTCVAVAILANVSLVPANDTNSEARQSFLFESSGVVITSDFPGGRLNDCRQLSSTVYEITVRPENTPINDSAWYAFQLSAEKPQRVRLRFRYENGSHRYWPKISRDGQNWEQVAESTVHSISPDAAEIELQAGPQPLWIAAQEILSLEESRKWQNQLAEKDFVSKTVLGYSLQGRSIDKLEIGQRSAERCIFIISRQHPPEISGTIGMRHFVEAIAGPSEIARRFRQSFVTIVVPVVNPDGVAHGHWRHNAAGVDLNRDWGPFHQRETRALRDELLTIKFDRRRNLRLFLDFHSTYQDVFYTQPESADTVSGGFTKRWLAAIDERFPNYEVKRNGGHGIDSPTSKNWVHNTFGVPAITYEYGDETDRDLIRRLARAAAEEMMRLMLGGVEQNVVAAN